MDERLLYYWLAKSLTASTANKLLANTTPETVWNGILSESMSFGLRHKSIESLIRNRDEVVLQREIDDLISKGIKLILICDDDYPKLLINPEVNPPIALYCKGDTSLLKTSALAVVGTRTCSEYGIYAAKYFSGEIAAAGVTIVSGLALGIDAIAHEAALNAHGKTIAVLGSGLDKMTPVSNYGLFKRICKEGLVISEYAPEVEGSKYTFPERNRIISGLSIGVLVVEAGERSGSTITATLANEQGREVFAVPGQINAPKSQGTNFLISEGAMIAVSPKRVLDELRSKIDFSVDHAATQKENISKVNAKSVISLDLVEQMVYNCLEKARMSTDELIEATKLQTHELTTTLIKMEIKSVIAEEGGKYYLCR